MHARDTAGRLEAVRVWKRRRGLAVILALAGTLALSLVGPAGAGAATTLGQVQPASALVSCLSGQNVVQQSTLPSLNYAVPAGGGVITSWSHLGGLPSAGSGRLQSWRGSGLLLLLSGRSSLERFAPGVINEFDTRILVSGGDLLGLRSQTADVGCVGGPHTTADAVITNGIGTGDPDLGFTGTFAPAFGLNRVNVAAALEPDADGDGFGDETQDIELQIRLKNLLRTVKGGFSVRLSCGVSACEATIKGKAIAKRTGGSGAGAAEIRSFKLKSKSLSIEADETKKTRLKLKQNNRSSKKLGKLLDGSSKGSKLKLTVRASNSLGDSDKLKDKAKLKP